MNVPVIRIRRTIEHDLQLLRMNLVIAQSEISKDSEIFDAITEALSNLNAIETKLGDLIYLTGDEIRNIEVKEES